MNYLLAAIAGLILGGLAVWLALRGKGTDPARLAQAEAKAASESSRAAGAEAAAAEVRQQKDKYEADAERLRQNLAAEHALRVQAETQRDDALTRYAEEKKLLDAAKQSLTDTFKALAGDSLRQNHEQFLALARENLGKLVSEARGDFGKNQELIATKLKPVDESLRQLLQKIEEVEKSRVESQGSLTEQVRSLSQMNQDLQKQTGSLVSALRTPKTVGTWGQMTLRRVVEMSGMSDHCDFNEEVSVDSEDGRFRPDMVVHLPGDREVVIDAKASFDAYHSAVGAATDEDRNLCLGRHASALRTHMNGLTAKKYWDKLKPTPEFVVMFIPGESFFAAAVDTDRELLEDGIKARVILATPTTLIALLNAVAFGWKQEQVTKNAEQISELGKQLYERMANLAENVRDMGRHLDKATESYNRAVSNMESRVLVSARKFKDLGAGTDKDIPALEPSEKTARPVTCPELPEKS
jgi:DNA recombination protein RmuC